jgi:shikimate kinase
MTARDRIYVIGFMGSGKTTTGLKLAGLLGWSFTDLDRSIEAHTGLTIPEIFSRHGEVWFRNVESELLRNQGTYANTVISTGGGTPCYEDNMNYMLETGLTIYLKLTPSQLKSRLSGTHGERPLIKDLSEDGLLSFIQEKLSMREKWYNMAELSFNGFNTDLRLIYSEVKPMVKA